eukprot:g20547.t1
MVSVSVLVVLGDFAVETHGMPMKCRTRQANRLCLPFFLDSSWVVFASCCIQVGTREAKHVISSLQPGALEEETVYGAHLEALFRNDQFKLRVKPKATTPTRTCPQFSKRLPRKHKSSDLGGGDQTPKRPPISIPSGLELVSILDDARDNIMCDMHKNRENYYVTCRVPKPRKEAQVKPRALMLRRRRIAKAKAIVGQLLGEAHGFTDAEVEEFTLQYMNLSDQLMFKPGDNQQAKITTQTLLHMDCKVMSDQSAAGKSAPLLNGEMLKTFESWEKEGWTSSATGIKYDVQLYVTGDMTCGCGPPTGYSMERVHSFNFVFCGDFFACVTDSLIICKVQQNFETVPVRASNAVCSFKRSFSVGKRHLERDGFKRNLDVCTGQSGGLHWTQTKGMLLVLALLLFIPSCSAFAVGNVPLTLSVDQGQTQLSVPVPLPKNFPVLDSLNLAYDSSSAGGFIGLGWNLQGLLSSITRCAGNTRMDGRPSGVKLNSQDRYCLDGAHLHVVEGNYGAPDSRYRTNPDRFMEIEAKGERGNGPAWFKVRTKEGMEYHFGETAESQFTLGAADTVTICSVTLCAITATSSA